MGIPNMDLKRLHTPVPVAVWCLILFCTVAIPLHAQEQFRFKYSTGQRFHIEGSVDEEIYLNDTLQQRVRIRNVGDLTVTRLEGDRALHEGTFSYYQSLGPTEDFTLEREYPTRFYRDVYGRYEISDRYFMPVVRGVPTFPKSPLRVGDQWKSGATEAHDFSKVFNIENPVIFPASVSYQYLGNTIIDGERIAQISINYVINHTIRYQGGTRMSDMLPYRVVGYFNQLYYWNLDRGLPHSYRENFDYIFILSSGDVMEYVGSSEAELTVTREPGEGEGVLEGIRNRLREEIPTAEVSRTPQGILINIGEILFEFDSDELTEGADRDLNNIVDVLEDFLDRRVRVVGHTDSSGPEEYNLSLSMRRARRTADELRLRDPTLRGRITYLGMGESKPIASNATEEGRRKNRRVEIIILNENE
jgi:outer membrane protein OmpA-like peptidoglycan-associated protein